MKTALLAIAAAAVALGVTGAALLYWGLYDISATNQHLAPSYRVLDTGMRQSVRLRAAKIDVPPLGDAAQLARGQAGFDAHCAPCHGAPGVAPEAFALGMTPVPANLVHTAREWPPAELFWVIKFGIKMSGMPAWKFRLHDEQIWDIVAFVLRLPLLSPRDYRELPAPEHAARAPQVPAGEPDAQRGRDAIGQFGCVTCHLIPGIVGANAPVGPPLDGIGARALIAGRLPNTMQNMQRWLRAPQQIHPDGAMPDLGVGERDARDMAAYLATLK
jgi:mono/diheme cytochrome c family protein